MKIQELIDALQKFEDKSMNVYLKGDYNSDVYTPYNLEVETLHRDDTSIDEQEKNFKALVITGEVEF